MEHRIQFVRIEASETAEQLAIEKLEKLASKYSDIISAQVFFKEEKGSNGKGKICDIRLSLPGPQVFASSDEDSLEAAVAETIRDLDRQLAKRKRS
jgi:putative sigma-54 modulation protein